MTATAPGAPAQTAPAQTAPAQTAPAQTAPAQTAPVQTVPALAAPAPGGLGEWDCAGYLWPDVSHLVSPEVLAVVAQHAAGADRDGELSEPGLAALRECGWPGLAVPTLFRGGGASLLECAAAQRALAGADPGLAVAVNMHLFSVGLMVEHWRRRTDVSWLLLEAIATQQRLVASAFAEPALAGAVTRSTLRAQRVPGGWEVTGVKTPCSMAAQADLVCLQFIDDTTAPNLLVALLPTTAPGLSVSRTWDTLGMRGSGSDTLRLERCHIPEELVFYQAPVGADDDDVVAAGLVWFCLTAVAVYLGIAQAALALAGTALGRLRVSHLDAPRAALPSYQAALGAPVAALLAVESACAGLAARMDGGADPRQLVAAALAVKQHAITVVPEMVGALVEACGGVAFGRSFGLERLWRDTQAIRFHPPAGPATRQYLARVALGLPAYLDLDEDSPRLRTAGITAPARPQPEPVPPIAQGVR